MYFIKLRNKKTEEERYLLHYDKEKNKLIVSQYKLTAQCYLSVETLQEEICEILKNKPKLLGKFDEVIIETNF